MDIEQLDLFINKKEKIIYFSRTKIDKYYGYYPIYKFENGNEIIREEEVSRLAQKVLFDLNIGKNNGQN